MPATLLAVKRFGSLKAADDASGAVMAGIAEGEVVRLELTRPSKRSLQFHRMFFALLEIAGEQVGWNTEQILTWVKIAVGHCDTIASPRTGEVVFVPRSVSFAKMSREEFNVFFDNAVTAILDRLLPPGTARDELVEEVFGRSGERKVA